MLSEPKANEQRALKNTYGLRRNEGAILMALYKAKGRCLSHANLLDARQFAHNPDGTFEVLKVYITRIRKKIGKDTIVNHWGHGYSLTDEGAERVKQALDQWNARRIMA
jgi:DNA-binding response OmpR family regulator